MRNNVIGRLGARSTHFEPVSPAPGNPYLSIQKAFQILELLAAQSPRGVTEIALELGLKKSSVSRLLKALSELGYAAPDVQRGKYQVSPRILSLAQNYIEGDPLVQEGRPILQELSQAVRANAHLAVLVNGALVIVALEPSPERIQVRTRVSGNTPLHASALGKILLASLPEEDRMAMLPSPLSRFTPKTITDPRKLQKALAQVREEGYAIELEEEHPGVGCMGAPVRDSEGRWIAALSVAGPLHGTPYKVDQKHLRILTDKAAELSRRIART